MHRAPLLVLAAAAGLALGAPPSAPAAPTVELMVVGKARTLEGAGPVRLASRSVRVGGRRCAVGRATPLSVLAGTRLRLALRDYGACSRSARDAGGLYVRRIGPDRARGTDGWVYKVGRRAGTSGAADPAGPFGTGRRLRRGDRVLWFWCTLGAGEGCQRTLEARPAARRVRAGAMLRVRVRGYDDHGRGVPVPGALVRLGRERARTGAGGVALVAAGGARGRRTVWASAPGAVRSFPVRVRVR